MRVRYGALILVALLGCPKPAPTHAPQGPSAGGTVSVATTVDDAAATGEWRRETALESIDFDALLAAPPDGQIEAAESPPHLSAEAARLWPLFLAITHTGRDSDATALAWGRLAMAAAPARAVPADTEAGDTGDAPPEATGDRDLAIAAAEAMIAHNDDPALDAILSHCRSAPERADGRLASVAALQGFALWLRARGRFLDALAVIDVAEALVPGVSEAEGAAVIDARGLILADTGAFEAALATHTRALETAPDTDVGFRAGLHRALALCALGQWDDALTQYEALLSYPTAALAPTDAVALWADFSMAFLNAPPQTQQEALEALEALALEVDDALVQRLLHAHLALTYRQLGRTEASEARAIAALPRGEFRPSAGLTRREHALLVNNLGFALVRLQRFDAAEFVLEQAVEAFARELGHHHPETLNATHSLLTARVRRGDPDLRHAVDGLLYQALLQDSPKLRIDVLALAAEQRAAEGAAGEAIALGKLALRELEAVEASLASAALRQGYRQARAETWRLVAELLLTEGRLAEAEQVLQRIKQEELADLLRDGEVSLSRTPEERAAAEALEALQGPMLADAQVLYRLAATQKTRDLTEEEQARGKELMARLSEGRALFVEWLDELRAATHRDATTATSIAEMDVKALGARQRELRAMPEGTVLLVTLLTEARTHLVLVTPGAYAHASVEWPRDAVREDVFAFRQGVLDRQPVEAQAQALYDKLVRPLEAELAAAGAKTLRLSLDGSLRYLPIAALHDGESWLVERYRLALETPGAPIDPAPSPSPTSIAAFGVSQSWTVHGHAFRQLPAVRDELKTIVRVSADDAGALPGRASLDDGFREADLQAAVFNRDPVLHIASHFHFDPADPARSFLLLGDGSPLTLRDLESDYALSDMAHVDLLTLSACETANGQTWAEGREVDGLGAVARRNGAHTVLASLWPVSDASTAVLMGHFYTGYAAGQAKADALAHAQIQLASGQGLAGAVRGLEDDAEPEEPSTPGWEHPFYWAPFVLLGDPD